MTNRIFLTENKNYRIERDKEYDIDGYYQYYIFQKSSGSCATLKKETNWL